MRELEEYTTVGARRLRCGYTTGTCAAAASRAAAELLLHGGFVPAVTVSVPAGIDIVVEVEEHETGDGWAQCAVRKDAGDDPDVTDGVLVYARVTFCDEPGGHVDVRNTPKEPNSTKAHVVVRKSWVDYDDNPLSASETENLTAEVQLMKYRLR